MLRSYLVFLCRFGTGISQTHYAIYLIMFFLIQIIIRLYFPLNLRFTPKSFDYI